MSSEAPACSDTVHQSTNTYYPPGLQTSESREATGEPVGTRGNSYLYNLPPVPSPPDMRAGVLWKKQDSYTNSLLQTQDIHERCETLGS